MIYVLTNDGLKPIKKIKKKENGTQLFLDDYYEAYERNIFDKDN